MDIPQPGGFQGSLFLFLTVVRGNDGCVNGKQILFQAFSDIQRHACLCLVRRGGRACKRK
jgi:hypothetical protein